MNGLSDILDHLLRFPLVLGDLIRTCFAKLTLTCHGRKNMETKHEKGLRIITFNHVDCFTPCENRKSDLSQTGTGFFD